MSSIPQPSSLRSGLFDANNKCIAGKGTFSSDVLWLRESVLRLASGFVSTDDESFPTLYRTLLMFCTYVHAFDATFYHFFLPSMAALVRVLNSCEFRLIVCLFV